MDVVEKRGVHCPTCGGSGVRSIIGGGGSSRCPTCRGGKLLLTIIYR